MNRFENIVQFRCNFLAKERSTILKDFSRFKDYDKEIKRNFDLLKGTYNFYNYEIITPKYETISETKESLDEYSKDLKNIFSKEKYIFYYIEELKNKIEITGITTYLRVISNLDITFESECENLYFIKYIKILYDLACTRKKRAKLARCSSYSWKIEKELVNSNININIDIINLLNLFEHDVCV